MVEPTAPFNDPSRATAVTGANTGKDLLQRVTEGAHGTVDRLAEKAGPAVHQVESTVAQAGELLHHGAEQARALGGAVTRSARETVREHPLTVVLLAVALGALIARTRR